LNDIRSCDDHLRGKLHPDEAVLFEAKLLISPLWRLDLSLLKRVHTLIRLCGRNTMKHELYEMHNRIFSDPDKSILHQKILNIFPESNLP